MNSNILIIIEKLNINNSICIKTEQGITKSISIIAGIRYGDSLILFNITMNEIIKKDKTVNGEYRIASREIKIVCYADDAIIITEDKDNLQRLSFFAFKLTAKRFNISIFTQKIQFLIISKELRRSKLLVYNQKIE